MTEILNPIISDACDIHVIRIESVNEKRISLKMIEFEGEIPNIYVVQWDVADEEITKIFINEKDAINKFDDQFAIMKAALINGMTIERLIKRLTFIDDKYMTVKDLIRLLKACEDQNADANIQTMFEINEARRKEFE